MTKKNNKNPELVRAIELRDKLKRFLEGELERLPETLEKLEAKDRLHAVLKLLPFVVARPEPVHHTEGEPLSLDY